jgi:Ala-tRNA(Pro) deacylase
MNCRERIEMYLREMAVPYEAQHHPRAFTAQDVAASEHLPGRLVAKVVMLVADGRMVMLVLPAPARVHLPETGRILGARDVRLAEEGEFASIFRDCEVGAMPPFGNLYNVPVYVDRALASEETIYFQAGTHTDTMSMRFADFERLVNPVVAAFSLEEAGQLIG